MVSMLQSLQTSVAVSAALSNPSSRNNLNWSRHIVFGISGGCLPLSIFSVQSLSESFSNREP